jgi:type IV pilus assembly protein PilY1
MNTVSEERLMRLRLPRLPGFCAGVALALFCGTPAMADDTEIFVGSQGDIRPNILFILDTSGSMDATVATQEEYDPATTYSGNCDPSRVYWRRDTGDPLACDQGQWFDADQLKCNAAVEAFADAGNFVASRAAQWDDNDDRWENIDEDAKDQPVECRADAGLHGENAGDDEVYAFNSGQPDVRWTSVQADQLDWDSSSNNVNRTYTFYNGNYLNWWFFPPSANRTRLQIVQEAASNLVASLSDVNIGLMRYSNNGGGGDTTAEGGMVTFPVSSVDAFRDELVDSIQENTADGSTPLSETLYEAHQYLAGQNVFFGNTSRIFPGTRFVPNPTPPPADIEIDGAMPSVVASRDPANNDRYQSPMAQSCQKNFIVYLTDGEPTADNSADDEIQTLIGNNCDGNGPGRCLDDLAGYMFDNDLRGNVNGNQNVTLYTIGFGEDVAGTSFLDEAATAGGGDNFFAGDSQQLTGVFRNILSEILTDSTTFVAPAVPVNAFNRTETLADLYISVFEPSETFHWPGNLKKYRIENTADGTNIVDADGDPAVDPDTGFFLGDTRSLWSASNDGDEVEAGGSANRQPLNPATRQVYTFLGDDDLTDPINRLNAGNNAITDTMLGLAPTDTPSRDDLLDWINGVDVQDVDEDDNTTEARRQMGDPLHGRPAVVVYGGTAASPDIDDTVIFSPTNDGYLHAIEAVNGTELWSFVPSELLDRMADVLRDDPQSAKAYMLDGDIRAFKLDTNQNGIVEASQGDRVLLFFGMRRGGNRYFALDVTDKEQPRYLWSLGPAELPGIGQSWSTPAIARIAISGVTQNSLSLVLIFGGGYDETQDNDQGTTFYNTDGLGNRVFMVDALSGDRLWFAGPPDLTEAADLELDRMNNSIPSALRVLDLDGNGFADRMYVGDTGGRLWRFDIIADGDPGTAGVQTPGPSSLVTGGVIASLGNADDATHPIASTRKFYETPDVSLVRRRGASTYLNIAIGSGWRGHPRNADIQDRFYAIRDYEPFNPLTQTAFNNFDVIADGDLADITTNVNPLVPDGAPGWKLELRLPGGFNGEKVLAESRTFNNVIFFPTYLPGGTAASDPCAPAGTNRAYAVSVNDGRPVIDINRDNQTTTEDRYSRLAQGGIAPEFTFLFPGRVDGDGGGDGGPVVGPGRFPPRCTVGLEAVGLCSGANNLVRTYWRQSGTR